MPYIKPSDRKPIDDSVKELADKLNNAGEFNYAFTSLLHLYLDKDRLRYQYLNEMIGMLECCKMELYRKVIAPYEDTKIAENGDVMILQFLRDLSKMR